MKLKTLTLAAVLLALPALAFAVPVAQYEDVYDTSGNPAPGVTFTVNGTALVPDSPTTVTASAESAASSASVPIVITEHDYGTGHYKFVADNGGTDTYVPLALTKTGTTFASGGALPLNFPVDPALLVANNSGITANGMALSALTARPAQTGDTFGLMSPLVASGKFTSAALSNAPASSGGGTVTVGGYAAGQDPYTLLMAGTFLTIPGDHTTSGTAETLTFKQMQAILLAVPASDNASTAPVPSSTATTSYYLAGLPAVAANLVYVSTVTYNAAGQQTGRTEKIAAPFPSVQ